MSTLLRRRSTGKSQQPCRWCDQTDRAAARHPLQSCSPAPNCALLHSDRTWQMILSRPSLPEGPAVKTLIQTAVLALAATIASSTFADDGAAPVHGVPSRTLTEDPSPISPNTTSDSKKTLGTRTDSGTPAGNPRADLHAAKRAGKDQRRYGRPD